MMTSENNFLSVATLPTILKYIFDSRDMLTHGRKEKHSFKDFAVLQFAFVPSVTSSSPNMAFWGTGFNLL